MTAHARPEDTTLELRLSLAGGERRTTKPEESAGWEPVRDSWFEAPPDSLPPSRSDPPPLPASIRELPAERSPEDVRLVDRMLERLAAGDYEAALMAAESLLHRLPRDADALDCAEMSRTELRKIYIDRLGGALDRIPSLAMGPGEIASLALDSFTASVVARIDGCMSSEVIAAGYGVSSDHALRVLSELYVTGVIAHLSRP